MNILSVDTSSKVGSLAIVTEEGSKSCSWSRDESGSFKGSHSEVITIKYQELLSEAKIQPQEFSHIAVSIGPGSFTGLRVAINFAKTLAYSYQLPLITLNSLYVMALQVLPHKDSKPLLVMNNAFKNMVFISRFVAKPTSNSNDLYAWQEDTAPEAVAVNDLKISEPHDCIGDGLNIYKQHFTTETLGQITECPINSAELALGLGEYSRKSLNTLQTMGWKSLRPLYIKQSSAEENLKKS